MHSSSTFKYILHTYTQKECYFSNQFFLENSNFTFLYLYIIFKYSMRSNLNGVERPGKPCMEVSWTFGSFALINIYKSHYI